MALETLIPDTPNAAETTQFATSKAPVSKSPFAITGGGTPTGVDPQLLENMQKMIAEREAQKNSFLETIKDVTAWGGGGVNGPSESLARRQKEREEQEATTFGMKSQIAQYKAQQALAQKTQANVVSALGGGSGAPGAGGGFGAVVDPLIRTQILNLKETDPKAAEKLLQDHSKKMAEIAATARMNKASYERTIEVRDANGRLETVSLIDILNNPQKYQPTETGAAAIQSQTGGVSTENIKTVESGGRPNAVSPKGAEGVMQVMPNTQTDPGFGVVAAKDKSPQELERVGRDYYAAMQNKYGHDTLAAVAYNMGPGKTDAWLKAGGDFNKLPAETQAYIGKVNLANALQNRQVTPTSATTAAPATTAVPVPVAPAAGAFNQIKPMPAMPKSAPLAPPEIADNFPVVAGEEKQAVSMAPAAPAGAPAAAPSAPVAPVAPVAAAPRAPIAQVAQKTMPELRAEAEANKEFQVTSARKAGETVGKQQEAFESAIDPISVADKRAANNRVIELVMGSPNSVGILQKPGMGAALATLAKHGLNTPSGAIGVKELEDALVLVMPGSDQKTINARNEIKQNLAKGELEASKLAQGQGSVSDIERELFRKVSGSAADTPELLIKRQQALVARENLNEKLGRAYGDFQKPGAPADYTSFKRSPEFRAMVKEYDTELNRILSSDIKLPKGGAAKPAIPKYDTEKENRYQQWKQSQGINQ